MSLDDIPQEGVIACARKLRVRRRKERTVYPQIFSDAFAQRAIQHVSGQCACATMSGSMELFLTHGTPHWLLLFPKMATVACARESCLERDSDLKQSGNDRGSRSEVILTAGTNSPNHQGGK